MSIESLHYSKKQRRDFQKGHRTKTGIAKKVCRTKSGIAKKVRRAKTGIAKIVPKSKLILISP